jgi:hypothetical protein
MELRQHEETSRYRSRNWPRRAGGYRATYTAREMLGVLDEISQAGVFLRGLDLNAFDDWISALVHSEPFIGFGGLFFPMWRVERISKDEAAGGVPSLWEQFEKRTGLTIQELLQSDS